MDSRNNKFISNINLKYSEFKKDILSTNIGNNICKTINNKTKQSIFQYQEFLFKYMTDLNNIGNKKKNR